jgi:hypothetical protein
MSSDLDFVQCYAVQFQRSIASLTTAISSRLATRVGASRTAHNLLLTNRRPPRPALLRYRRLRVAGLGSVTGVVLARETGGRSWVRFDKNHCLSRNKKHLWHACGVGKKEVASIDTLLISNKHFSQKRFLS